MRFDIMTLFPDMFDRVFDQSIIGRAKDKGLLELHCHQIREYTKNKQMQVDDYPYGGGMGMVMFPQPIADCFRAVCDQAGARPHLIYMSPQGKTLTQQRAIELAVQYQIAIQYDETAQAPYFHYTDNAGTVHEVWFEDARSCVAKFQLIPEYGFRGIGYWNFMRPFTVSFALLTQMFDLVKAPAGGALSP